jgi:hypothetical protein
MLHAPHILRTHPVPLSTGGQQAAGVEVHVIIQLENPVSRTAAVAHTRHSCVSELWPLPH